MGRSVGTGREGSSSGGKLPGFRGSLEGGEVSYILFTGQQLCYAVGGEEEYHVPPALSLLSKTWILSKYFSAAKAAAVIAPTIRTLVSSQQIHNPVERGD